MNAERWREIEQVLDRALDTDPSEWKAVVADACGTDEELRREVELLLAEHGRSEGILESGAGALAAEVVREHDADRHADTLIGTMLGPWRVVRQVGKGGMSRVFLGERGDGLFAQRVAIKVLRAGLDTDADVERFRAERQILASLDHPNIARLLDGGVASDGRPYLVLEFIEGEPLAAYCNARGLDVRARLALFLAVADATQSAHRQLVVHRDLKPSNILVGTDGRVRLLDFGVAKILDPTDDGSGETGTRRRWMTPEYAAPEQFTGAAVTTATDVYQLGGVLYELLCGHRPFDAADDRVPLEVRVLRDDPPPPSSHAPALRGDLDAVVLKALRKAPDARYASVAELAADVQRYLDGAPVAARAGDRAYRWRRQARRHALSLSIAAAAVVTAGLYTGTLVVQNRRIARALAEANVEREKSEQVTGFLLGLFRANDARSGRGDTITARALLERGEQRANALERQPAVQAEMLDVIGRVRGTLGAYDEARPILARALDIRRRVLGDSHPDVAQSLTSVANLDEMAGRYADAERGYRSALAIQRATLGDTAVPALMTLFKLGFVLHGAGRYKDAAPVITEWERLSVGRPHPRTELYAQQLQALAQYDEIAGRTDTTLLTRAERRLREVLSIQLELFGPRHADVGYALQGLASVIGRRQGRAAESDSLFRAAIRTLQATYPDGHPDLSVALMMYASRLMDRRRYADALPLYREALDISRRYLGPDHPTTTTYLAGYGDGLRRAGDYAAAEPLLREAVDRFRRQIGPTTLIATRTQIHLGDALRGQGRVGEAEALLLPAYTRLAAERGVQHPQSQYALRFLVRCYDQAERRADATKYRALLVANDGPDRARSAM